MRKINCTQFEILKPVVYVISSAFIIYDFSKSIHDYNSLTGEKRQHDLTAYSTDNHIQNSDFTDYKEIRNYKAQTIRIEESKEAFLEAYKVFMHPRCMNCHPAGDVPLQGDDSHLHTQGVKRGPDGKGLYALKCKNCHQDNHLNEPHLPPGFPVWHLPPAERKMVFEGKSPRELAAGFKDPNFTRFNTMERFIVHVENDPLVKNSFTYGTQPTLTHDEFVEKVKEWIEKGAALPDE